MQRNRRQYFAQLLLFFIFSLTAAMVFASPKIYLPQVKVNLGTVLHSEIAKGTFIVVNRGDEPLKIEDIATSCGCAVVEFKPGSILPPGAELALMFTIDTTGKMGEVRKQITIKSNDPDNKEVELYAYIRVKLKEHEKVDRTAIFKGQCKSCHVGSVEYLLGEDLFEAVCYMCHGHYGLGGLARRINDYAYVTHNSDEDFYSAISNGIENTSMPGYAKKHGGPLDEHQIQSLVELMRWWEEGFVFKANEERRSND